MGYSSNPHSESSRYVLDIEKWLSLFPFDSNPKQYPGGETVIGPESIAKVVHARRLFFKADDPSVPTDVFVFGIGEPSRRDITKVGGLPYFPAGRPWPETSQGRPRTFLAQFSFAESRDIMPQLPGDMLLVFVGDRWSDDPDWFHFEWHSITPGQELIGLADVPIPDWEFINCYGTRFRTVDYVDLEVAKLNLQPILKGEEWFEKRAIEKTCWIDGMKIGGIPCWHSSDDPSIPLFSQMPFLCALTAIYPRFDRPWPWVNWPSPVPMALKTNPKEWLYFYDGFGMYFFLDTNGNVVAHFQQT